MKYLFFPIAFLSLIFWPLSLFLHNISIDFVNYCLPIIILLLVYFISPLFLLALPLISVKLALIPLIFFLINKKLYLFLLSLIIFIFLLPQFQSQSVFNFDHNARQAVISKSQLYPSVLLARVFQNKWRIPLDKISNNFFALTDLNNYFFGFHPREILVDNQNLAKFPFMGLLPFLIGLFYFTHYKRFFFITSILIASLINLSLLNIFDRTDFVLFLPLSVICFFGLKKLSSTKYFPVFVIFFIIFTLPQLIRLTLIK